MSVAASCHRSVRVSRREWLAMLACGFAATARAQDSAEEIVLLTAVDPSVAASDDILEGLAFGAAEASRLAALLERASRLVEVGHDAAALRAALAARPRAGAMVAALTPAGLRQLVELDPAMPVLAIVQQAQPVRHPRLFTVAWSGDLAPAAQASGENRARGRLEAWHPSLFRYGAGELNERFARAAGRPMSSAAWAGWAAVKAAMEAVIRAGAAANVSDSLRSLRFDAHKGRALRFDECGRLVQPMYRVGVEGEAKEVVEQAPTGADGC